MLEFKKVDQLCYYFWLSLSNVYIYTWFFRNKDTNTKLEQFCSTYVEMAIPDVWRVQCGWLNAILGRSGGMWGDQPACKQILYSSKRRAACTLQLSSIVCYLCYPFLRRSWVSCHYTPQTAGLVPEIYLLISKLFYLIGIDFHNSSITNCFARFSIDVKCTPNCYICKLRYCACQMNTINCKESYTCNYYNK